LAAIAVLFVTVRLVTPSFFDSHIGNMGSMHGPGAAGMGTTAAEVDDAPARALNEGFLVAAGVALPLAVAASVFVSRQLARPMRSLAAASGRIAGGDYAQRAKVNGPVELEELGSSFNTMAAALEGVEQRRIALIGDVAHELRTPVTVLRGYVEGLADGVFPAAPETWAKLDEETRRLTRLVEELRDLSRAEAGQVPVSASKINPRDPIRAAAERFEPAFAEQGLTLELEGAGAAPTVIADPERVVQVLSILLDNALRYSTPGGVVIRVQQEGERAAISVRDSGAGLAAEDLPHVFERFYRVDRSRSRSSGGSGVGLTIGRAIAIAMGGDLRAESPGLGKGSTFTLLLPIAN
jgi:histidine kinase